METRYDPWNSSCRSARSWSRRKRRKRLVHGFDRCLGRPFYYIVVVSMHPNSMYHATDCRRNLAYQFILALPRSNTLIPIILPTLYLWIVDTIALRRGTWVIESETKLEWHLWEGLDAEEAIFFLLTNVLVVFGLIAFDNAYAIVQTFPDIFSNLPGTPSPIVLIRALAVPPRSYDEQRLHGLKQALGRLRAKSRSFYLASGVFQGRLRLDLILLYSFCRVADDLVDDASTSREASEWIQKLRRVLDLKYACTVEKERKSLHDYITSNFPSSTHSALLLLPTEYLSPGPLYDLLSGFETDVKFSTVDDTFPIHENCDLETYGGQVAGTVAESCLELVYHHSLDNKAIVDKVESLRAGRRMGIALQYVNIARDIAVDAANRRVYLPTSWLKSEGLRPYDVIESPEDPKVERLRQKLLDQAMSIYDHSKQAIEDLPQEARGPMRVAVESYVEIGRMLRNPGYRIKAGRATVPKTRRLRVAWNALQRG